MQVNCQRSHFYNFPEDTSVMPILSPEYSLKQKTEEIPWITATYRCLQQTVTFFDVKLSCYAVNFLQVRLQNKLRIVN